MWQLVSLEVTRSRVLVLQMQFVRDNDAVGAILAGAGSRPAEELVTALRKVCAQHQQDSGLICQQRQPACMLHT